MTDWKDYEFRYISAGGVQKRNALYERYWSPVSGNDLLSMDAKTLRRVAGAMEKEHD